MRHFIGIEAGDECLECNSEGVLRRKCAAANEGHRVAGALCYRPGPTAHQRSDGGYVDRHAGAGISSLVYERDGARSIGERELAGDRTDDQCWTDDGTLNEDGAGEWTPMEMGMVTGPTRSS